MAAFAKSWRAVGGIVEATNNRIPFLAPPGGWQAQMLGATTTVDHPMWVSQRAE